MNAIVPDWSWVKRQANRGDKLLYMISTNNQLAFSPEQPSQPSLSEGQEGAKNPPVVYPSDTLRTTQLTQKIIPTTND